MEEEKFKKKLIEALEDDEVINILKKIFNKKNDFESNNNLEEFKELKEKLKIYETENLDLKKIINEKDILIKELKHKNTQLENNLKSMEKEVEILEKRFIDTEKVYQIYLMLNEKTKDSLKGIFKGNTIEEFIYCGVQKENIDSLWEYIKKEAMLENEIENLEKIFDYFFRAYNKIYENPVFARNKTNIGEQFDEDKHIRVQTGKTSGTINLKILEGYYTILGNKVIKKSVVKI